MSPNENYHLHYTLRNGESYTIKSKHPDLCKQALESVVEWREVASFVISDHRIMRGFL